MQKKKVAVLILSCDEDCSSSTECIKFENRLRFVKTHDVELKRIDKKDAYKQLDAVKNERFDLWVNFMWGRNQDTVGGFQAVAYAETLGVPMIGTSSKSLSMSKIDFKLAASRSNICTPQYFTIGHLESIDTVDKFQSSINTVGGFPLIVKSARDNGSLHMTENSVCNDIKELEQEVERMRKLLQCEILVEKFIVGKEYSAIVMENTDSINVLSPFVYIFPDSIPDHSINM